MSKFNDMVDYALILIFIIKLGNLMATLILSNSLSQELVFLNNFRLLNPEDPQLLSIVDSMHLWRLAEKVPIICSTLEVQGVLDAALIVCLAAKGVCAHRARRKKTSRGIENKKCSADEFAYKE